MDIRKTRNRFFAAAAGTMIFAAIYELFSHRVYSNWMIFAFLIPLLGGAVPWALLSRAPRCFRPGAVSHCLYSSGLAALTAGSLFRGVLEIYGTTSRWSPVYGIAGGALALAGIAAWLHSLYRAASSAKEP
ncbi:MAG: hypothetical protein IJH47_08075 [Oscillospiraceae bacterium]|nr:hypothetical protein [Oscillospiraceae bacterium]